MFLWWEGGKACVLKTYDCTKFPDYCSSNTDVIGIIHGRKLESTRVRWSFVA
jgi:hypothetical protein